MTTLEQLDELERVAKAAVRNEHGPVWTRSTTTSHFYATLSPAVALELIFSLRSLQEDNARLKSEGDAASARWLNAADSLDRTGAACYAAEAEVARLTAERDTARAENTALKAALEPFAKAADALSQLCLGADIDHWPLSGNASAKALNVLTLGDLRAAARVLASEAKDGE